MTNHAHFAPRWIAATDVTALLPMSQAIAALRRGFSRNVATIAPRQMQSVDGDGAVMLQMPVWAPGVGRAIKIMSAVPANASRGLPVSSEVLNFFHPETGALVAVIEAAALTRLRTAAASALAADYLAPAEATRLALFATGPLAPALAVGHATVRDLREIVVCGRDETRAAGAAAQVKAALPELVVRHSTDAEAALAGADIASAATRATAPVIHGRWLRPDCHVDLVGGYTPAMREADDETLRGADIWLDQREAAMREPGDIVVPLNEGTIFEDQIRGDLSDLVRLSRPLRPEHGRTVFKSVGHALEDLYAAEALLVAAGLLPGGGGEASSSA